VVGHKLLEDATRTVRHAFGGQEVFSCLTGSIASGTATPASDIDLLVVLPDHLPLAEASAGREIFTRLYVDLHRRHRRTPDLRWPGEVLFAADLDTALAGGVFVLDDATGRLTLCQADQPYRYWVSMIAAGVPLSHPTAFERAAHRCATTIVRHLLSEIAAGVSRLPSVEDVTGSSLWHDWGLRAPARRTAGSTALASEIDAACRRIWRDGPGVLENWRSQLHRPTTAPPLEQWAARWSSAAHQATSGIPDMRASNPPSSSPS
jgi:predicted nucleotidyltransferase